MRRGEADHADIMCEVFPAKLSAKAEFLCLDQQFLFQLQIAERLAVSITFSRQRVIVVCAGQFHRFKGTFR